MSATPPTLPPAKAARTPFSFARHRNSLVLIAGCVLLLIVARACNSREIAARQAAKDARKHDSLNRDQSEEAENRAELRKNLDNAYRLGKEEQARNDASALQADHDQTRNEPAQLTPAQQERIGQIAAGVNGVQQGTAPRERPTPTTPATPASLVISYRGENESANVTPPASATPATESHLAGAPVLPPPAGASAVPAAAPTPATAANAEDAKHDLAASVGEKYRVRQGTWLPCTEELRINGALASGINCLVSIPIYSTSGAHLLIPMGTVALGHVQRVTSTNQERLFVSFDTLIMPDGFTCSAAAKAATEAPGCVIAESDGMDQIGQAGLRDKVNHHYAQIFGASLAIASIAGLSQIGNYGTATVTAGAQYRAGITQSMSESSMRVLDRFIDILPTFVIREGARNNIHLPWNVWLPDYANHRMKENL